MTHTIADLARDFTASELAERLADVERSRFYRQGVSHAMTHAHNLRCAIKLHQATDDDRHDVTRNGSGA